MSSGRRCALPGCYVVIEPAADGRPQRKYCTAAHRAVARQARREGVNRSASAPPLLLQELPLPPLAPPPESGPARRRRAIAEAAGRRARAMAVLGSAGLLVTGGTLMVSSAPQQPSAVSASPWLAADPEAGQQWAEEARVSLASLDQQLAEVDQAEQSWQALPASERGDREPATVRALGQRRTLLQQQRTSIASELASYETMHEIKQRLEDTERHVASLDRALAEVPRHRELSPAERDAVRQLSEQRATRDRQRQAQQQELDGLLEGLRDAMSTPLPSDDTATRSITSAVRDLVRDPAKGRDGTPEHPLDGQRPQPEVTAPGDRPEPGRQDVGNGAPQVPGRDRPDPPKRPDVLAAPSVPDAGGILDSVRKLPRTGLPQLGGGASAPDAPGAAHAVPTPEPPGRPGGGLLNGLGKPGGGATPTVPGTPVAGTPAVPSARAPGTPPAGGGPLAGIQKRTRGEVPSAGSRSAHDGPLGGTVGQAVNSTGRAADSVTGTVGDVVGGGRDQAARPDATGGGPHAETATPGADIGVPDGPRSAPVTPPVPELPTRQVDFDGPNADEVRAGYDAADTVISGLPFGDGVKDMARSAVAEELRSQQGSGELSDYDGPKVTETLPRRSSEDESGTSLDDTSPSSRSASAEDDKAREVLRDFGFDSSGSEGSSDEGSAPGADTIDRMIDSYGGSSLSDSDSDEESRDEDSRDEDSVSSFSGDLGNGDPGDMVERYRGSGQSDEVPVREYFRASDSHGEVSDAEDGESDDDSSNSLDRYRSSMSWGSDDSDSEDSDDQESGSEGSGSDGSGSGDD